MINTFATETSRHFNTYIPATSIRYQLKWRKINNDDGITAAVQQIKNLILGIH
jgi:hypothetical protein